MSELATVEVEQLRGVAVVHVAGEVDVSNAPAIRAQALDGVGNEGPGLVIDLTATSYLDSAGIHALFDIGERLQVRGMELRIVAAPNSFIVDVLETVRMADRFAVDSETVSAVAILAEQLPGQRARE